MSSFHLTSIAINEKAGTVHLTGYDSNVFTKRANRFESSHLSEMLQTQGREAVDSYMLEQYQGGMVKGGNNDYNNTLALYGECTIENLEKLRQLKNDGKGEKYVVSCPLGYLTSITTRRYKATMRKESAAQYDVISAMIKAKRIPNAEVVAI